MFDCVWTSNLRLTGVAPTYDHTLSHTYHYCDRNINIFSSQDSSHTFHLFFLPEFPLVWRLVTATFLVTWSSPCVLFGYLLTKSKVQNINWHWSWIFTDIFLHHTWFWFPHWIRNVSLTQHNNHVIILISVSLVLEPPLLSTF